MAANRALHRLNFKDLSPCMTSPLPLYPSSSEYECAPRRSQNVRYACLTIYSCRYVFPANGGKSSLSVRNLFPQESARGFPLLVAQFQQQRGAALEPSSRSRRTLYVPADTSSRVKTDIHSGFQTKTCPAEGCCTSAGLSGFSLRFSRGPLGLVQIHPFSETPSSVSRPLRAQVHSAPAVFRRAVRHDLRVPSGHPRSACPTATSAGP